MRGQILMLFASVCCCAVVTYTNTTLRQAVSALCSSNEFSDCTLQIGGACPSHIARSVHGCTLSCSLSNHSEDTEELSKILTTRGESIDILNIPDDERTFARVDLRNILERYTGYDGSSIWKIIYKIAESDPFLTKLISGMHCSVSVHLCAFFKAKHDDQNQYFMNHQLMRERVAPAYLKNMHYLLDYLLSLLPLCLDEIVQHAHTSQGVAAAEHLQKELPKLQFIYADYKGSASAEEKCAEISSLVPCMDCLRCKVWGKVQLEGLKSSLRILQKVSDASVRLSREDIVFYLNLTNQVSIGVEQYRLFLISEKKLFAQREEARDNRAARIEQLGAASAIGMAVNRPAAAHRKRLRYH
ncbi:ERO1-like protein alpha [Nematocida sp. AWRm77]|nr:ERO1-like protein alpha [Nematocida sp. AWRm77]